MDGGTGRRTQQLTGGPLSLRSMIHHFLYCIIKIIAHPPPPLPRYQLLGKVYKIYFEQCFIANVHVGVSLGFVHTTTPLETRGADFEFRFRGPPIQSYSGNFTHNPSPAEIVRLVRSSFPTVLPWLFRAQPPTVSSVPLLFPRFLLEPFPS